MHFVGFLVALLVYTMVFLFISEFLKKAIRNNIVVGVILPFLIIAAYSIGIAVLAVRFSSGVSHSWIYYVIGGILCFSVNGTTVLIRDSELTPAGNLLFTTVSLIVYLVAILIL